MPDTALRTGGQILVEQLRIQGCDRIFTVPGESFLAVLDALHEGHLIDWLHEAQARGAKAVIINPGGYSHTSVALHDAVKAIATPVIEVHLSDPDTRESFRHTDLVALAATEVIKGKGAYGYALALDAAARL